MKNNKSLDCPICGENLIYIEMKFDTVEVLRCQNCGHAFSNSILPLEQIYTHDYFKQHQNWFNNPDYKLFRFIKNSILKNEKLKFSSIIDVGCGNGNFLKYLQTQGFENLSGIDLIENSSDSINFFKGDIFSFETAKKFDVVVSMMNIEHIQDVDSYLKKLIDITKQDGLIIINTINEDSFIYTLSKFFYRIGIKFAAKRLYEPHHINHFSIASLSCLYKKNNLKKLQLYTKNYPLKATDTGGTFFTSNITLSGIFFINLVSSLFKKEISQLVILKKLNQIY